MVSGGRAVSGSKPCLQEDPPAINQKIAVVLVVIMDNREKRKYRNGIGEAAGEKRLLMTIFYMSTIPLLAFITVLVMKI